MNVQPESHFSPRWRKSRHSADQGNCVEIAPMPASILVRDSQAVSGPVLIINSIQWARFLLRIRGS